VLEESDVMASVTEDNHGKRMATDVAAGAEDPDRGQPPQRSGSVAGGGFFTIYKKGQGYWTRMLTAAAAILLIVMSTSFLYRQLPVFLTPTDAVGDQGIAAARTARNVTLGVCAVWVVGMSALAWFVMNRPRNADFLIATDSEMKKVNWTSRRELIGSTKVVIFFMFMIAAILFLLDMYFTRVFYLLNVLVADSWLWETGGNIGQNYLHVPAGLVRGLLDIVGTVLVFGSAAWAVIGTTRRR
jgi:preprotein translocase subunit SecE